jgi:hypothetical protein
MDLHVERSAPTATEPPSPENADEHDDEQGDNDFLAGLGGSHGGSGMMVVWCMGLRSKTIDIS